jgi:uncharacterized membrane protein YsdA (DUF1294 family)
MAIFLMIVFLTLSALTVYAFFKYYSSTPADQTVWKRMWTSVLLAAGAIATGIGAYFTHQGGSP